MAQEKEKNFTDPEWPLSAAAKGRPQTEIPSCPNARDQTVRLHNSLFFATLLTLAVAATITISFRYPVSSGGCRDNIDMTPSL